MACKYILKPKIEAYKEGYNDRCDGNPKQQLNNRKLQRAYNTGWKEADE